MSKRKREIPSPICGLNPPSTAVPSSFLSEIASLSIAIVYPPLSHLNVSSLGRGRMPQSGFAAYFDGGGLGAFDACGYESFRWRNGARPYNRPNAHCCRDSQLADMGISAARARAILAHPARSSAARSERATGANRRDYSRQK